MQRLPIGDLEMTDKQRQKKFELKTEIETWMSYDNFFDVRISWL